MKINLGLLSLVVSEDYDDYDDEPNNAAVDAPMDAGAEPEHYPIVVGALDEVCYYILTTKMYKKACVLMSDRIF